MLRRPLNGNEYEYDIKDSTKDIEQKFYRYFLDYIERRKLDIVEHQIIINPLKFKMEIRIRMNKLHTCFGNWFSLDELIKHHFDEDNFKDICNIVAYSVEEYAKSLCFKNKEEK